MIGILARLGRAKAAWSYVNALRVKAGLSEVLPSHRTFGCVHSVCFNYKLHNALGMQGPSNPEGKLSANGQSWTTSVHVGMQAGRWFGVESCFSLNQNVVAAIISVLVNFQ